MFSEKNQHYLPVTFITSSLSTSLGTFLHPLLYTLPFSPGNSAGKESTCSAEDPSSIPRSERSPGEAIGYPLQYSWASLLAQMVKNLPTRWETRVRSLAWEDPWRRGHGNPLQYSCPENPHGQRSLAGYSPWGCKESDMTEQVSTSAILNCSKSHVEATIIEQMVAVVVILLLIAIFFSTNVKILPVLILSHLYIIIAKTYYSTYHVTAKSLTVCHINQGGVSS